MGRGIPAGEISKTLLWSYSGFGFPSHFGSRVGAPRFMESHFAKIRLASSSVSFEPISYHEPGTIQVYTGTRG